MILQRNECSRAAVPSSAKRAPKRRRVQACGFGLQWAVRRVFASLGCLLLMAPHGMGEQPGGKGKEKPFIRPIAPMGQLFADNDLFRAPWSSFGSRRTPARLRSRPATVPARKPLNHLADLDAVQSASVPFADGFSLLERALSERAPALTIMPQQNLPPSDSVPAILPVPSSAISPARASQIQAALVRFGYLAGAPTGTWDAHSVAAIRKLQSDHHWQTKFAPDARALIFLGLGPQYPAL